MPVPIWQPGELYQPGDLVRPSSSGAVSSSQLQNPSFESGAGSGWTLVDVGGYLQIREEGNPDSTDDGDPAFIGTWRLVAGDIAGSATGMQAINDARIACVPGQPVTASCDVFCFANANDTRAGINIRWYNGAGTYLSSSYMDADTTRIFNRDRVFPPEGLIGTAALDFWTRISATGVAPANAASFTAAIDFIWFGAGGSKWLVDNFTVAFASQAAANPFNFRAVQTESGFSGNSEPDWPTTLGLTVVDNEVTWEAVAASHVVWEANRILVSGGSEPTFPTGDGAAVPDNTITWVMDPRRVSDTNAPRSKVVALAASKVFIGNDDIVAFSATVNPLDYTTNEDAGYLPTGLQLYGSNPVAAFGLYRSNLVVFNAEGFQMWQVDEDPQNMALLDSGAVGSTFHKAGQPVANDWVFLTNSGFRNIGIAGASTNLQAGYFGKQVDELVIPEVNALQSDDDAIGLYNPGTGQYMCFFGAQAFVLTVNGGKTDMSWSTYTFPSAIDYWTLLDGELYLRSGDLVWRLDLDALTDDIPIATEDYTGYATGQAPSSPWTLGAYEYVSSNPADLSVTTTPTLEDPYNVNILRGSGSAFATPFIIRRTDGEKLRITNMRLAGDNAGSITLNGFLSATASVGDTPDFTQTVAVGAADAGVLPVTEAVLAMPGVRAIELRYTSGSEIYLAEFDYEDAANGTEFEGELWWHYIDSGQMGEDQQMEGFDLVIDGTCDIQFGFDESDESLVTTAYTVNGDTLPGTMIPMPLSGPSFQMRLTFAGDQEWEWYAAKLYM